MFNFKKSSTPAFPTENIIKSIDLNNVVSICFVFDNRIYLSRFFSGKRHGNANTSIIIGIKGPFSIPKNSTVSLTYNMLNGERFSQTGLVTLINQQMITVELDTLIEKSEERRKSIKIDCELTGEITVANKKLFVEICNICIGGIFVKTDFELLVKSIYSIHLNELDASVKVEILRHQKSKNGSVEGYGCQFSDISEKNEQKIIQHINMLLIKQRQTLISRDVYNYNI